jgi:hypothetical protein
VSRSDSLADADLGSAHSRVVSDSDAGFHASALSDGIGVSVSGPRRHTNVNARAASVSRHFGNARSNVTAVEIE